MAKNLVIVESPAKAKTIERFLGKDFKVESSFGHIADLPTKELGVDVENNFQPKYIVDKEKKVLVKKLKDLAGKAEMIWLASDEDREGEAISWHLMETLNLDSNKTRRIVFNSITKKAIQNAIDNPRIWSMRSRPGVFLTDWWDMNFLRYSGKKLNPDCLQVEFSL